jgi:predicted TIM-barrel fold metal-dependent hydrolase
MTTYPLFSANAHVIEPANLFEGRVPAKWADAAPRLLDLETGGQFWLFGEKMGFLHRTCLMAGGKDTGWWQDVANFNTIASLDELRPGCYDAKHRIRDMDEDGIAVTACTSSPAGMGFGGDMFSHATEPELGIACMKAWNDWYHEEWVSAAPDRFVPVGCTWYRDPEVAAAEVRRNADRGFKAVALRNPTDLGEPWFGLPHWDPLLAACEETGTVIVHHTEGLDWFPRRDNRANMYPYGMTLTLYQACAMDFLAHCMWGGITVRFPKLKILIAEAGGSWLPHFIRRIDWTRQHSGFTQESWPDPGLTPLEMLKRNFAFSTQEFDVPADLAGTFGTELWMVEEDYPHIESYFPNTGSHINGKLAGLSPDLAEAMAWKNASRFFDFPMPARFLT